ncbi:hypothetical protein OC835_007081 [Tilletia horrida]|nr:hypothetical protein OC835_007081 [Tilletia horrida]
MPALQSRPTRFITHLCITADVVLGDSSIADSVVTAIAHILNRKDEPHEANLTLWARATPEAGAYLIAGAAFGTNPLTLHVNETSGMRLIPEEVDGSIDGNPTLASTDALIFCLGVLKSVSADKKSGAVGGFVFLGKKEGWVEFELHVFFEDTARWQSWGLPGPRSLVYLDALLDRVEDGKVYCALRRIFAIDAAPQQLLTALKIGQTTSGSTSKASLILGARQRNSAKASSAAPPAESSSSTADTNEPTAPLPTDTSSSTIEVETPNKASSSTAETPTAPKILRAGTSQKTPPSPSPSAPPRKRTRAE